MGYPELGGISFELPPLVLLWPLVLAVGVYVLLRWVIVAPGGRATAESISQHALWIGILGWMGSSLQGAVSAGVVRSPAAGSQSLSGASEILAALAWPILTVLLIHAVGQFTYPEPRKAHRVAPLSVRRIADFLPRRLAWTTAGIFIAAAIAVCYAAALPGYEVLAPTELPADPNTDLQSGPLHQSVGRDGRVPGYVLGACLGGALVVLALGTWSVLALIARRRQLETLDPADNDLLRTIAMNRLLRTIATVAGGLLAIAGNYSSLPDPAQPLPGAWLNYSSLASLVILLLMLGWRPPRLTSSTASGAVHPLGEVRDPAQPATKLIVSLGAALPVAAVGTVLIVPFLPFGVFVLLQPASLVAVMAGAILLTIAAGELLLQRKHGQPGAARTIPRQPISPALFTVAVVAAAAFLTVLAVTIRGDFHAGALLYGPEYGWTPPAITTGVIMVLATAPLLLICRRQHCGGSTPGLDTALRGISLYRLVRTIAAFLLAQAGILMSDESYAWRWLFGLGNPLAPSDAYLTWDPALIAGAILCAAAIVLVLIPVRSFVPRHQESPAGTVEYR